ncbi:cellulose synthase family protein [Marinoscillum furvescens]|uniref:Cellulose synthase/poly-beta-1,6-N-acetylglucosamine synthase-like glycosyltransferase n=1 Tax=Marinoscillum furvescens DSM 4134 TaxID=1122208 RepID=A0A3D9L4K7_MARFU|nr:cellulose synthase family protein [Marinoscillum furvescens]RED99422.1 cellulose synthase/poly-beta-1,6-N-acetylglucosamine synthase-like glycosyltransferase [Marinoscillum furvescens DSM 4134]
MDWIVVGGYVFALLVITIFSLEQLYLAILYMRKKQTTTSTPPLSHFPQVTIQLPVYNEKYVVKRLIDCICALDYPLDRLEIQVLDDSTDETKHLIAERVAYWQSKGINIEQISRPERVGFKAGALQYGLEHASGELIAIFDADFLPEKDFLLSTLPHFKPETGMVQTRWGHLNENYSLLTRMQAFGLNAHFSVEQTGRNSSGKFMNFNGTAGIWRKQCIEEAGGWHYDTLTEDLDLSYRAQLKGWKFTYLENITSPAELPVLVPAIKSQQYRWNKGAAEVARKNALSILKSSQSLHVKLHAVLHLFNSSVFLFLFLAATLSVPMLLIKQNRPEYQLVFQAATVFVVGFIAMSIFYWVAARATTPNFNLRYYLKHFPLFLTFTMGMALHNAIAVAEGYLGIKSPFIRTPKFNIRNKKDSWKGNTYLRQQLTPLTLLEGFFAAYFAAGVAIDIWLQDWGLVLFHGMLAIGLGAVFILSVKPLRTTG